MKIGILPLGRPTFDVDYADEKLAAILRRLDESEHEITGPRRLLFDATETRKAIADLRDQTIDHLLILQVTFTDASMTVEAAAAFDVPLAIWAVPEPRLGGRLRLNAFCGLNLASHALSLSHRAFNWAYCDADDLNPDELLTEKSTTRPESNAAKINAEGERIASAVRSKRIARIGEHPDGFHTCAYDPAELMGLADVSVVEIDLNELFDTARKVSDVSGVRALAGQTLDGLEEVDQDELDRSLKLKTALEDIKSEGGYDAFAIRCWPETFTEYGGAVCGPVSMMGEARVPCACEADVYGALTQLILQEAAQAPVFLTDLVDVDAQDDSAVVWHCGQAPTSMRADGATATIHTNRKMPLLYEFTLKPGPVTLMRISQAFGETCMTLSQADMLDRPMAFTGTSGVMRFARPASDVLNDLIGCGMEHHMALAYGNHIEALEGTAAALGIPVLRL